MTNKDINVPINDCISRAAAIDDLRGRDPSQIWDTADIEVWVNALPSAQPKSYREGYQAGFKDAQSEPRWIPCSERLPEEDTEVLISYRYKDGEGDTSHVHIDITTYGQMYFGGNKVGNHKYWRAPFEYFESNYEVIAWMPLPEPYSERRQE